MTTPSPMRRVLIAADPAQAEAVRTALTEAGIDAQLVAEDGGMGAGAIEVLVPVGFQRQARQIIDQGHWPRLA